MGKVYKKNVELVISHVEGSSGNFLARLYANVDLDYQTTYRTDVDLHPEVLAVGYTNDLLQALETRYIQHSVIVTHCQDCSLLQTIFPAARILQIYPYSKIGNVLYNISTKKLKTTLPNLVDNHFLHIIEWFESIEKRKPTLKCFDFGDLSDKQKVQDFLGIVFDHRQNKFFETYWKSQLEYQLSMPSKGLDVRQLIDNWKIKNFFCPWSIAWTIFVYEKLNGLDEKHRTWTIDQSFESWQDVEAIQSKYMLT